MAAASSIAAGPHFLAGPSPPPAAPLLPMLLLLFAAADALPFSCACSQSAAVFVVVLDDAVRDFLAQNFMFPILYPPWCMLIFTACIDRRRSLWIILSGIEL